MHIHIHCLVPEDLLIYEAIPPELLDPGLYLCLHGHPGPGLQLPVPHPAGRSLVTHADVAALRVSSPPQQPALQICIYRVLQNNWQTLAAYN